MSLKASQGCINRKLMHSSGITRMASEVLVCNRKYLISVPQKETEVAHLEKRLGRLLLLPSSNPFTIRML